MAHYQGICGCWASGGRAGRGWGRCLARSYGMTGCLVVRPLVTDLLVGRLYGWGVWCRLVRCPSGSSGIAFGRMRRSQGYVRRRAGFRRRRPADRLSRHGPNQLVGAPPVSPFKLLVDEFRSPLVVVLLAAALVLVGVSVLGDDSDQLVDAALIGLIVLLNGGLGFTQNYRANRGIESLNKLAALSAQVLRGGVPETIDAKLVVPGDVVLLEEGDRVPADGRLLESVHLRIDESALTGESLPVAKTSAPSPEEAILAERSSMAFSSTVVMRGRGRMLVTDTGMGTEVGKIAEEVQTTDDEPTVFQREVGTLAVRIGWAVAILIAIVAGLQLLIGDLSLLETFITAVALAVAAVPEGLPVVLTLALAFGTRRILERKALVRSLPVVEIVGAAQVICSDKTGTITEGRMTVRQVSTVAEDIDSNRVTAGVADGPLSMAVLSAGLCNNAHRHPEHGYVGDPTETALLEFAERAGAPLERYERTSEIPFASERKMMSVVAHDPGEADGLMLTKGAPEVVVPLCDRISHAGGRSNDDRRAAIRPGGEEPDAGRTGAPGPGARLQAAGSPHRARRGGTHLRRSRRDERSAEARSRRGDRRSPASRHPGGDDHRGSHPDRSRRRAGSGSRRGDG